MYIMSKNSIHFILQKYWVVTVLNFFGIRQAILVLACDAAGPRVVETRNRRYNLYRRCRVSATQAILVQDWKVFSFIANLPS